MKEEKDIFSISILLIKKRLKILTDSEKLKLKQYKEEYPSNVDLNFDEIVDGINEYSSIDNDKAWDTVLLKLKKENEKPFFSKLTISYFKYAAIIAILFASGYFYQNGYFSNDSQDVMPEKNITLQLDNGDIDIISEDGKTEVIESNGEIVGTQKEGQLVYSNNSKKDSLIYNTLTVPYGKRFELMLSDGTNVQLNAGTSLRYPVKFIEGKDRRVFLKYGEAYFSVTKDVDNPFVVSSNNMDLKVLGTEFNISAYSEEENINTVLVEGAVSLYNSEETYDFENATNLEPGLMGIWNKENYDVKIEKVDVEMYTAWMKGQLILKEVSFKDMLKKIERQYDVTFINNKLSLNDRFFTARFDIEDVNLVMKNLSEYASFDYEIDFDKNIITIN